MVMAPPSTSRSHSRHCSGKQLWMCLTAIPFLAISGFFINVAVVFGADNPYYTFDNILVHGFGSGEDGFTMNVTGNALNPNNNIDFYLLQGNSLSVSTDFDVGLCGGSFRASLLAAKETAAFQIVLRGPVIPPVVKEMLMSEIRVKTIPLKFAFKLRAKIQGVAFKTWIVTRRVQCRVVVNGFNDRVAILSHTCR